MNRRPALVPLLCLAAGIAWPPRAGAEQQIVFERAETRVSFTDSSAAQPPPTVRNEILLGMGRRYFYVRDRAGTAIYDFTKRRVLFADSAGNALGEMSIFATVAFREMEGSNRRAMERSIKAMGIRLPGGSQNVFDIEADLGLSVDRGSGEKPPEIQTREVAGSVSFAVQGRVVTAYAPSDARFEDAGEMFRKYLLFECKVHPTIRAAIAKRARIPSSLVYRNLLTGESSEVALTLKTIRSTPDTAYAPLKPRALGAGRSLFADDSLLTRLSAAAMAAGARAPERRGELRRFVEEASARGDYLDAYLAITEHSLETCEDPPAEAWSGGIKDRMKKDKRVKEFDKANQFKDARSARRAVAALEAIDREGLTKGYIIDTNIANAKQALGDLGGGKALLVRALESNPRLAGAWADLAQGYIGSFATASGFRCVEVLRALVPEKCWMLERFRKLEEELAHRHPECF